MIKKRNKAAVPLCWSDKAWASHAQQLIPIYNTTMHRDKSEYFERKMNYLELTLVTKQKIHININNNNNTNSSLC